MTPDLPVMPPDAGAMVWSARPSEGRIPPLLVMLHGHGGNELDLAAWFSALPDGLRAVSLRGPVALGERWTWYDHAQRNPAAFDAAVRGVLAWVATLPAQQRIGLFGFSQGGAVAIQLMRLAPRRFDYAVHLSAFVMPGRVATDEELAAVRPPVFSAHGTEDDVILPSDPLRRLSWLRSHTTLTQRTYPGLGHAIEPDVVADASHFIAGQLGGLARRRG